MITQTGLSSAWSLNRGSAVSIFRSFDDKNVDWWPSHQFAGLRMVVTSMHDTLILCAVQMQC